ncbi:hypothetical protein LTR28_004082 [Elasticomyces elasticus]|nr:hypothetical protein LTR28_004082 [Elasticomyces elasticus]
MEVIYDKLPSGLKTVDFVVGPIILFLYAFVACAILLLGLLSNYKTTKALRSATMLFYLCGLIAMCAELITITLKVAPFTAPSKLTIRDELILWVVIFVVALAILLALVLLSLVLAVLAVLLGRMLMHCLCSSSEPSKNGKHFVREDAVTAKVMPIVGSILFTLIHLCTVIMLSVFALAHPFTLLVTQDSYGMTWLVCSTSMMIESLLVAHAVFTG